MEDLIKRLEAATGPDRELDLEIAGVLGHAVLTMDGGHSAWHFTASVDAALMLVPEGWIWTMWAAQPTQSARWDANASVYYKPMHKFQGEGATPAIALCIAALRARGSK